MNGAGGGAEAGAGTGTGTGPGVGAGVVTGEPGQSTGAGRACESCYSESLSLSLLSSMPSLAQTYMSEVKE